jgi:hypothetical protein
MRYFLVFFYSFFYFIDYAQITDGFTDGNFTLNPNWVGSDTKFEVNNSFQLHSKSTTSDSIFLTIENKLDFQNSVEWHFWMKHSFSPSSNNFSRFYLITNSLDLKSNPDGYYLQFGETGTNDAIRLFRRKNSISTQICAGTIGAISTNFITSIKVVREPSGEWKIYSDFNGGENYTLEASAIDNAQVTGKYSGVYCQFTKTYATKFYYDNFYLGPKVVDKTPPICQQIQVMDNQHLKLTFSESIDSVSAEIVENYSFLNSSNTILSASRLQNAITCVMLELDTPLQNATNYTLRISQISDLSGNVMLPEVKNFYYIIAEKPEKGEVIINEIMSNPSPVVGLPEIEYVEIYNKSNKYFNLENWIITDGTSKGKIASAWIGPKEYKVLCSTSGLPFLNPAVGVSSFPSLNNSGDKITLLDSLGNRLDELDYALSWYKFDGTSTGGISLERINPFHPCSDASNWKGATHPDGGTPNEQNSVYDTLPDNTTMEITSSNVLSDSVLKVVFSKQIDTISTDNVAIQFVPEVNWKSRIFESNSMQIILPSALEKSKEFVLQLNGIQDCWMHTYSIATTFANTEMMDAKDIVINELLFNPYTDGADFIELYNTSEKWINLKGLSLFSLEKGLLSSLKVIEQNRILKPQEYVFLTPSIASQEKIYPNTNKLHGIQMPIPTMNNDSGTVILMCKNQLIDKVSYEEGWHFPFLNNREGKSLERLSASLPSNEKQNWYTASENEYFATPGNANSHTISTESVANISVSSETISPDNDGFEDLVEIHIANANQNSTASISIYTLQGNEVNRIVANELISQNAIIVWDGLDAKKQELPVGIYILYIQILDLQSAKTFHFKHPIIVAKRL